MPTQIQSLNPLRRSVPTPAKPVNNRSDDRRDDFQQILDEASNKPADRPEAATKATMADAKKPAERKAAAKPDKTRGGAKGATADEPLDDTAPSDAATTEDVETQARGDAEPQAANTESESGRTATDDDDDAKPTGDADPNLAQLAAAAQAAQQGACKAPVDTPAPDVLSEDGAAPMLGGSQRPGAPATGATSTNDKGNAQTDPDADPVDTSMAVPTDATVADDPEGSSTDGQSQSDQPGQQGAHATAAAQGAAESKAAVAPLAAQNTSPPTDNSHNPSADPTAAANAAMTADAAAAATSQFSEADGSLSADAKGASSSKPDSDSTDGLTLTPGPSGPTPTPSYTSGVKPADLPPPPEAQFASTNHDNIVTGVKGQLLPHGGSMEIRLDPPELGALKVMVEMRDGTMTATFQTNNEEATRLLSHSLNHLKTVLEGQGVNVERLQVQQAPKSDSGNSAGDDPKQQQQQQNWQDEHAARQEQQRKEMLRRMWRRVSGAADPIDVTA